MWKLEIEEKKDDLKIEDRLLRTGKGQGLGVPGG